jgi:hypothetical protein
VAKSQRWPRFGEDGVMTAVISNRNGVPIRSVKDWGRLAKPAATNRWKDGRSAKEVAKSWIAGDGHAALSRLHRTEIVLQ